jgi:regulator of replication initiation timing
MLEVFINNVLVPLIVGGVSALTSWFLARKKYNSEVDSNLIENMENSLEFYKTLSDDNRARLDSMMERNQTLERELQELRKQVLNLTLNICMDLTCVHRIREHQITKKANGKDKDRFNQSPEPCKG